MHDFCFETARWEAKARRRRLAQDMRAVLEAVAVVGLVLFTAWLFLVATPAQMSAECEALRAEMDAAGG